MDQRNLKELAEFYDVAFNFWEIESPAVKDAKRHFWILLESGYDTDCPEGLPSYDDYRRQAVMQCKRWLSKGN